MRLRRGMKPRASPRSRFRTWPPPGRSIRRVTTPLRADEAAAERQSAPDAASPEPTAPPQDVARAESSQGEAEAETPDGDVAPGEPAPSAGGEPAAPEPAEPEAEVAGAAERQSAPDAASPEPTGPPQDVARAEPSQREAEAETPDGDVAPGEPAPSAGGEPAAPEPAEPEAEVAGAAERQSAPDVASPEPTAPPQDVARAEPSQGEAEAETPDGDVAPGEPAPSAGGEPAAPEPAEPEAEVAGVAERRAAPDAEAPAPDVRWRKRHRCPRNCSGPAGGARRRCGRNGCPAARARPGRARDGLCCCRTRAACASCSRPSRAPPRRRSCRAWRSTRSPIPRRARWSFTGRAPGDGFVRVYLDNTPVTTSRIEADGDWRSALPDVDTGVYTLRVDEVDADGNVTSRLQTPFKREDKDLLTGPDGDRKIRAVTVQPGNTLWALARALRRGHPLCADLRGQPRAHPRPRPDLSRAGVHDTAMSGGGLRRFFGLRRWRCLGARGPCTSVSMTGLARRPRRRLSVRQTQARGIACAAAHAPRDGRAAEERLAHDPRVAPYLWPERRPWVKRRVVLAMIALILAKVVAVGTPFFYKRRWTRSAGEGDGGVDARLRRVGLTVAYGMARLMNAGLSAAARRDLRQAWRSARCGSWRCETFRTSTRCRCAITSRRKTGGLSRIIERGVKGVEFLLRFLLFSHRPADHRAADDRRGALPLFDIWYLAVVAW